MYFFMNQPDNQDDGIDIYVDEEIVKKGGMEGLKAAVKEGDFATHEAYVSRLSWGLGMVYEHFFGGK